MALYDRPVPTLTGEDAERFIEKAEQAEKTTSKKDYSDEAAWCESILKDAIGL